MKNFPIQLGMICCTIILVLVACDNNQRSSTPATAPASNVPEQTATMDEAEQWIGAYDPKDIGQNIWISRAALERILTQDGSDGVFIKMGLRSDQSQVNLAWASFDTTHNNTVANVIYQLQERSCICRPCCPPDTHSDSSAAH